MKKIASIFLAFGALAAAATGAFAQSGNLPKVELVWVRPAVPGQQGTGAYMKLTASQPMQLVGISSPVAGVAQVHEMKMEGDVMRMRAVAKLDLPAGQTVELKPGGYHVMLMDLKQPLAAGDKVPLSLVFRDSKGVDSTMQLDASVQIVAPRAEAHKH